MNIDEAKKAIAAEKEKRQTECAEKINALLKEHQCDITTDVHATFNGQVVRPVIVALDLK